DRADQGADRASQALSKGQPFAPRSPQARRPAPPPSCVPDEEGQRALPGRHRTARTPPLGAPPPDPGTDRGPVASGADARVGRPAAGRRPPPRPRRNGSLVSDLRD